MKYQPHGKLVRWGLRLVSQEELLLRHYPVSTHFLLDISSQDMSREQQLQIPPEEVIANFPLTDRAWNGKPHRPNSWRSCLRLASGALGTKKNLGRLLHLVHLLCFCTGIFHLKWNALRWRDIGWTCLWFLRCHCSHLRLRNLSSGSSRSAHGFCQSRFCHRAIHCTGLLSRSRKQVRRVGL
jgi:hypothetical protein